MKIGRITLVDPSLDATDKLGPELEKQVGGVFEEPAEFVRAVVRDAAELKAALIRFCDEEKCELVFTTGGIGPHPRDVVPEVTLELLERELPGFGETVRHFSFQRGPIALLSRAVAGVRGKTLIVNLPSRPAPVYGCMKLLREAIVECIEQLTGKRYTLFVDPIVIPIEKWFPFMKRFRVKPDPRYS